MKDKSEEAPSPLSCAIRNAWENLPSFSSSFPPASCLQFMYVTSEALKTISLSKCILVKGFSPFSRGAPGVPVLGSPGLSFCLSEGRWCGERVPAPDGGATPCPWGSTQVSQRLIPCRSYDSRRRGSPRRSQGTQTVLFSLPGKALDLEFSFQCHLLVQSIHVVNPASTQTLYC